MNKTRKATILVVDDEESYRNMISAVLEDAGYESIIAESGKSALEIVARRQIDAAVLDLMMPGMDGRELMNRLKKKIPDVPIIFLTAHGSIPSAVEAIKEGAADYLTKPLPHVDDLLITVNRVLEHRQLKRQSQIHYAARKKQDPFPCASPTMKKILETAAKVAATDVTVLITGESGTGKERMAQFIHLNGRQAENEMVAVNCAAIVETLLESELFGHEKGAFTGAIARKAGKFELADGGTVFLDEIGELPLELQSKLLRVLQESQFERVGGIKPVKVDVRVIAATNRDLATEVREQRFREDLFFRLNVFPIFLPALKDRGVDIVEIADAFIGFFADRMGRHRPKLAKESIQTLLNYHWPGNIRELRNVIERAMILCNSDTISITIPDYGLKKPHNNAISSFNSEMNLADVEKAHITAILEKLNWKVRGFNGAALALGLKPTTLESKMKKLGIRRPKPA